MASILPRRRMSFSVTLAKTRLTLVLSSGFPRISSATWSMGVMPVPPATMPTSACSFGVYWNFTMGPLKSRVSPTLRPPMCLLILPCSYTFTTRSRWPTLSLALVGVYGLMTLARLPSSFTEPMGARTTRQLATGRPAGAALSGKSKRSSFVLWLSCFTAETVRGRNSFAESGGSGDAAAAGAGTKGAAAAQAQAPAPARRRPMRPKPRVAEAAIAPRES
mmetsp:Transcript_22921/g.78019  ORF Transcript_22921/g.78019 Transcript_22921/m.78019 type:complete len:220 (+) Transcript_22921:888-1547(+)